jgi:hypothetical protein
MPIKKLPSRGNTTRESNNQVLNRKIIAAELFRIARILWFQIRVVQHFLFAKWQ